MYSKYSLLLLLSLLSVSACFAQYSGKVRVFTQPKEGAIVKLDSIKLSYGKFLELDTGTYTLSAWAPKRVFVSKDFRIDSGSMKTIPIKLSYSNRYKNHRRAMKIYKVKKFTLKYGPAIAFLVFGGINYQNITASQKDADTYLKEANLYADRYEDSFWKNQIDLNQGRFLQNQNNYQDALEQIERSKELILVGAASSVVLTYLGWKISKKIKKPKYDVIPLLSSVEFSPYIMPSSSGVALKLRLR